ncbi:MAG: hypothetical protein JWP65_1275 [Ramlibacter sp.]|jgi:hypothetical protein|nr:hypothetical protein [Ramlibacter sp.]
MRPKFIADASSPAANRPHPEVAPERARGPGRENLPARRRASFSPWRSHKGAGARGRPALRPAASRSLCDTGQEFSGRVGLGVGQCRSDGRPRGRRNSRCLGGEVRRPRESEELFPHGSEIGSAGCIHRECPDGRGGGRVQPAVENESRARHVPTAHSNATTGGLTFGRGAAPTRLPKAGSLEVAPASESGTTRAGATLV